MMRRNKLPAEVDPFRSGLFQLFVNAERSGLIADDSALNVRFERMRSPTKLTSPLTVFVDFGTSLGTGHGRREAQAMQTRLPAD